MFLQRHFLKSNPTELEDIEQNLALVLRSKRGAGHDFQAMGLPDMHFRTAEQAVETLKSVVPELIARHERRLEIINVDDDFDDDGRPYVTIACVQKTTGAPVDLVIDGSSIAVQFKLRST